MHEKSEKYRQSLEEYIEKMKLKGTSIGLLYPGVAVGNVLGGCSLAGCSKYSANKIFANISSKKNDNHSKCAQQSTDSEIATISLPSCEESSKTDTYKTTLEKQLNNYISKKEESFNQCLFRMIDKRGLKDSDVYNRACISRQLFSKIRCKPEYIPSKSVMLSLAIGMRLTIHETEELLACGKQILSRSDTGDLIVRFFIEQEQYDIDIYNDYLYEYHQHLLGSTISS